MNQPWDLELIWTEQMCHHSAQKKKISKQVERCRYRFCTLMNEEKHCSPHESLNLLLYCKEQSSCFCFFLNIRLALGFYLSERSQTNSLPSIHYYVQRIYGVLQGQNMNESGLLKNLDILQPLTKHPLSSPSTQGWHAPFYYGEGLLCLPGNS